MIAGTAHPRRHARAVHAAVALLLAGLTLSCGDGASDVPSTDGDATSTPETSDAGTGAGGPEGNSAGNPAENPAETPNENDAETGSNGKGATDEIPSLEDLVARLDAVPADLELGVDPDTIDPNDPAEWPAIVTVGGEPVRTIREFHPTSGLLTRIATARPEVPGSQTAPTLHGLEWRFHDTGSARSVQWYRDDVPHGPVRQWRKVGTIVREGCFEGGERDGLWRSYSKNGKLMERAIWSLGVLVGQRETWFASGQAKESETYLNGKLEGRRQVWDRNGLLLLDETYRNGERDGRWSDFHPGDGDPREWGQYENGVRVGLWQRGSAGGVVLSAVQYVAGVQDGSSRSWNEEGVLVEELTFEGGQKTGPSRTWYGDGTPQSEGRLENGRRVGRWTYWKNDGSLNERWSGLYEDDLRVAPLDDDASDPDEQDGGER